MVKKHLLALFGLVLALTFAVPQKAHAQVSVGVTIGAPVYVHPVRPYVYAAPVVVPRPYVYPRAYVYSAPVVYRRYYRRPYWRDRERWERHERWEHRGHRDRW
jgi:hypothetical protein